jgi:hypothetical protein
MQAGGNLNAFATRFRKANFVVLYSELLSACGDNTAARDMIIAHELGTHQMWTRALAVSSAARWGFVPFWRPRCHGHGNTL